jgi:hypothetical protein
MLQWLPRTALLAMLALVVIALVAGTEFDPLGFSW